MAEVRDYGNRGFSTCYGLFCNATISDAYLNAVFAFDPENIQEGWDEDLWERIISFVEAHVWVVVPDDTGTHFVVIASSDHAEFVESLRDQLRAVGEDWSQVTIDGTGAVQLDGFMSRYGPEAGGPGSE